MCNYRFLLLLPLLLLTYAYSEQQQENLDLKVAQLVQQNEYEEALELLREADNDSVDLKSLQADTHLAYANYLTHEADHLGMSERMANALRHFRRVLELDNQNRQAQSHIELIEGIYQQMGRDIPEGVAE